MTRGGQVRLAYVFDAHCGWCHGFAPTLRAFVDTHADVVDLRVLPGGLYTGARALPVSAYPSLLNESIRVAELTGAVFGAGYRRTLAEGVTVVDSTDAATGLVALLTQPVADPLRAVEAMQEAWFVDGRSLSNAETYREVATELDLDPQAVVDAYAAPATRVRVQAELRAARRLNVASYPTLLLHTAHRAYHRLGGPLASVDELNTAFADYVGCTASAPSAATAPSEGMSEDDHDCYRTALTNALAVPAK